jgi:hypothetical protein
MLQRGVNLSFSGIDYYELDALSLEDLSSGFCAVGDTTTVLMEDGKYKSTLCAKYIFIINFLSNQ